MKNERNKRMLAYLLCVVLAVTSLAGSGVAQGSITYAQEGNDGKGDTDNTTGSGVPEDQTQGPGQDSSEEPPKENDAPAEAEFKPEEVATGAAFSINFDKIDVPEPETDIPELKDIIPEEAGKLTVVSISTPTPVPTAAPASDPPTKQKKLSPEEGQISDSTTTDQTQPKPTTTVPAPVSTTIPIEIKRKDVKVQWLMDSHSIMDDNNDTGIKEEEKKFGFRYGREYSVKVSYSISSDYKLPEESTLLEDKQENKQFYLNVNGAHYTLKKNGNDNNYTTNEAPDIDNSELTDDQKEKLQKDLENVRVELSNAGELSITKTFPLQTYTEVNITLKNADSGIKVTCSGKDIPEQESANEIIFDVDDKGEDKNWVKITLKPKKQRRFSGDSNANNDMSAESKVTVKVDNKEIKSDIEIVDGKLVIHKYEKIVTMPFNGVTTTAKKGSSVTFSTFRNYVGTENESGDKADSVDGQRGGNDNNQLKCTYNYEVHFKWGEKDITDQQMQKQTIDLGINSWACEVYRINSDNHKERLYSKTGKILGYKDVTEEIELTKSCDSKTIAEKLFGKSSGIKISSMKVSDSDKKYISVKNDGTISADQKFKKDPIEVSVTKIQNDKEEPISLGQQSIAVKIKVDLPKGWIRFKTKNKGRRIDCDFSSDVKKLASKKYRKNYGIKSVKVKIKYSKSKSKKQKDFKTAPAAVKRYFQPTVPKKERYVTSRKKFTVKRFQAVIVYKTESGTVKKKMEVKGKYK